MLDGVVSLQTEMLLCNHRVKLGSMVLRDGMRLEPLPVLWLGKANPSWQKSLWLDWAGLDRKGLLGDGNVLDTYHKGLATP